MTTLVTTAEGQASRHQITRILALLVGFTMLCLGMVTTTAAPAFATGGTITGTLSGWQNETSDHTQVTVGVTSTNGQGGSWSGGNIDAQGKYTITDFEPGTYYLHVTVWNGTGSENPYQSEQILDLGDVDTVTVAEGATVTQNATMHKASAKISGKITVHNKDRAQIILDQKVGDDWVTITSAWSGSGLEPVNYSSYGLVPGTYRAVFLAFNDNEAPEQLWWDGVRGEQLATPIVLASGQTKTNVNALFPTDFDTSPTSVSVTGDPVVGAALTAKLNGSWTPTPEEITYMWHPLGSGGMGGPAAVSGPTYTPTEGDAGGTVLLQVTAQSSDRKMDFVETEVEIGQGSLTAGTPTISGTAQVGSQLTADAGKWGPDPVKLSYQWLRNGTAISGATQLKYALTEADLEKKISLKVTGTKSGYKSTSKTSAATALVAASEEEAYVPPKKSPFVDVSTKHKFYTPIAWMFDTKLSKGVNTAQGKAYQPNEGVSRQAMAAFLYRLEKSTYKGPKKSPFVDVKPGDKYYNEITWMYAQGLSTGVATKNGREYKPKTTVSRQAMAAFIYRLEKPTVKKPQASSFADIKPGDKYFKEISWMYSSGLSTGFKQSSGKPTYAPKKSVSRQAMAAFLYRLEMQK